MIQKYFLCALCASVAILLLFLKTKKPRLMTRRGDKTVVLFSFFPKPMMLELELAPVIETKSDRLPWCQRASPSTTRYESVQSTDADRLIYPAFSVKNFLAGNGWGRAIIKKIGETI